MLEVEIGDSATPISDAQGALGKTCTSRGQRMGLNRDRPYQIAKADEVDR